MADLVAELEARARRRFVRWDPSLWQRVVEGPARALAGSLQAEIAGLPDALRRADALAGPELVRQAEAARQPEALRRPGVARRTATGQDVEAARQAEATLESYLRLASEAIGLGYLFPPEVGEGFLNHAFFTLLPEGLAALPPASRAQALADCWNLGENLEHAPPWWRRMFVRLAAGGGSLASLGELVARAEREAFGAPSEPLGKRVRHCLLDLGAEDRLFLPGALHFVAPTVVCVHDAQPGRPGSQGAWLADPPLALGAMGCTAELRATSDRLDVVASVQRTEPCTADELCSAANDWRAAFSLQRSQLLVAIYPA